MSGAEWSEGATRVGRPKPPLVPSHRNLAIDRASHLDEGSQDNGRRRANQYLVGIVVRGGSTVLGRGGALVGIVAAVVLTVGGIGAAVAVQPDASPAPPTATATRMVTIIDQPVPDQPVTTTTTAPAPQPAQAAGSASATITVIITKPVP